MVGSVPLSLQPHSSSSSSLAATADGSGAATMTVVAPPAAGDGGVASAEEEAFKRNTDCVYFLASPLTCKKGSECEYRHSDIARVNPRDCWYWLHGNCLNPKCAFRHPPLDGLLGSQMPNPMETPVPASQPATTPAPPVSYTSNKQGVPCIFFQKGNCLKGDWCPFLHLPNSASNKVMHNQAAIPSAEPPTFKKTFGGLEKFSQEKRISQTSDLKSPDLTSRAKPLTKVETAPAKQEINVKTKLIPSGTGIEFQGYRPIESRNANSWPSRVQQPLQISNASSALSAKDPEEVSREPSPGFDVLVDNELGNSDYYNSDDHFGRTRDHDGMSEFYDDRSGDYSPLLDTDPDVYRDSRGYDSYERLHGRHVREQRRSSERLSGGLAHPERRQYGRADSPDQVDESDLRHHLSKHRRVNGLRSVINHEHAHERPDERGHQGSRKALHHDRERQENSLSSRLRGRINVPGISSLPTDGSNLRCDWETERGRNSSGLSPGRTQVFSRLQDRIKGKVQGDFNNDGRNNRGLHPRQDIISDNNAKFAAPKSLAELKSRRNTDGNDQPQSMGKRKFSKNDYPQQIGDDLSFEGPKPLQEILKRKRGTETAVFGGGLTSRYTEDNNQHKTQKSSIKNNDMEKQIALFSESKNVSNLPNHIENEEYKLASGINTVPEGAQSGDSRSFSHYANEAEVEEGMIMDDGAEDKEPEPYDQRNEEFDYEQGDDDNYNLDEGDNGDAEEEYPDDDDDDDGDDFAKKMGVMY